MGALSIPLQVKPPEIQQPMQNIGALMQLRGQLGEIALRQAQAQEFAAQAQQRQRDLQDQNTIQQAMRDPKVSDAVHSGDFSALEGRIQPKTLDAVRQSQQTFLNAKLANTKEQNEIASTALGQIAETGAGLLGLRTPDGKLDIARVNAQLPDAVAHLNSLNAFQNAGFKAQAPTSINSEDELRNFLTQTGSIKRVTDMALAQQKEQQAISESKAKETEALAGAEQKKTETKIQAVKLAGMEALTPQAVKEQVASSIDQKKYPSNYQAALAASQRAVQYGLGPEGVQAAIKDERDKIASRENAIAQAQITSMPFREAQLENQRFQRTQQSYQFHAAELDKLAQPVTALNERVQRLNDTIAQHTPQADALVAPELLSVMSGGQGSGLRMNEAEISRIIGGRSKWQDLQAAMQKWSTDPQSANSITEEQRQQIHGLVDELTRRTNERTQALLNARSALAAASGPEQHRVILSDLNNKLGAINTEPSKPVGGTVKMKAPNGTTKDIPADQVAHYKSLGAVEAQ